MTEPLAIVLAAGKGSGWSPSCPRCWCPSAAGRWCGMSIDAAAGGGRRADGRRRRLPGRSGPRRTGRRAGRRVRRADRATRHRPRRDDVPRRSWPSTTARSGRRRRLADAAGRVGRDAARRVRPARRPPACWARSTRDDPTGYGRIVRDAAGEFVGIVEEKDATPEQRAITEVNLSTYVFDAQDLLWRPRPITADNSQREYYLTDCPASCWPRASGSRPARAQACEALSINSPEELARGRSGNEEARQQYEVQHRAGRRRIGSMRARAASRTDRS